MRGLRVAVLTAATAAMVAGVGAVPLIAAPHAAAPRESGTKVLSALTQGNRRFVKGTAKHPHTERARVRETWVHGQHPQAVILACADSRVAPELVFDQGIGDLFTIRVAGNVANEDEAASVEYAAEHLGVPVCVVLGHTGCGAVTAVLKDEKLPHSFDHLLAPVRETVSKLRREHPELHGSALAAQALKANVWRAMADLLEKDPALRADVRQGKLRLVGAIYDTPTGIVKWLGRHPNERALVSGRNQAE